MPDEIAPELQEIEEAINETVPTGVRYASDLQTGVGARGRLNKAPHNN